MLGPANRLPIPLMGMLDFQSQGRYPNFLEEGIRSSIDITEMLALMGSEYLQSSAALSGTASLGAAIVPAGEAWYVLQQSAIGTAGGAEVLDLQCQVQIPQAATFYSCPVGPLVPSHPAGAAGAAAVRAGIWRPYWAPPGSTISCLVARITTAGTITVTSSVVFLRVPI